MKEVESDRKKQRQQDRNQGQQSRSQGQQSFCNRDDKHGEQAARKQSQVPCALWFSCEHADRLAPRPGHAEWRRRAVAGWQCYYSQGQNHTYSLSFLVLTFTEAMGSYNSCRMRSWQVSRRRRHPQCLAYSSKPPLEAHSVFGLASQNASQAIPMAWGLRFNSRCAGHIFECRARALQKRQRPFTFYHLRFLTLAI